MNKKYQMMVFSICLILGATSFIGAFSSPIANTIIVTFGDSPAETAAVDLLQQEIPDAINVEFGGFEYNLLKMRAIGPVIFTGHGSDQGIQNGKSVVSVERMDNEIRTCPSPKIVILACDSDVIATNDESGRVFGFSSVIEAELAALETVLRINIFQGKVDAAFANFERYLNLAVSKMEGERDILPLAFVYDPGDGGGTTPPPAPYFSSAELWNAIRIFVIGCVFALIGYGISVAMAKLNEVATALNIFSVGATQASKMSLVFSFVKTYGISTMGQAVTNVYGGYPNMVSAWLDTTCDVISDWTSALNVGEWILFIGICALELLVIILTAGAEAAARLAVGISLAAVTAGTIAICDALDSDSTPAKSILQAISSLIN